MSGEAMNPFAALKLVTIRDYIGHWQAVTEEQLASCLPEEWQVPDKLRESMHYSLMAGGKRLRPVLVYAAAEAAGGRPEAGRVAAPAIRIMHPN